jgi:adenine-specific DNA methylase
MEAIKVDFKANKSIQKSEYCEYLYFISNSKDLIEDSNSEVVLGEYNPETDSYDLYYLEK